MPNRLVAIGLCVVVLATPQAAKAGWFGHRCRPCCPPSAPCVVVTADDAKAPAAEDAIKQVLNDQVAAWNKGDLKGYMQGYWNSPDLTFFSGGNKTQGWQATLDFYTKKYQGEGKEMGKLSFSDIEVTLLGADHAVVKGRFLVEMSKTKLTGLFTLVFKRTADGWRIVHDHSSV